MLGRCFDCHRSEHVREWIKDSTNEDVLKELDGFTNEIEDYKESLSRFLTMRASRDRTEIEYNTALHSAQNLVTEADNMIHVTSAKLSEKTQSSYKDISRTKIILYVLVIMTTRV